MLVGREGARPHVRCVALEGAPGLGGEIRIGLHEARGLAVVETEQVVEDEHLPVAAAARADPDGGHRERFGDAGGDLRRHGLQHDREAATGLEGDARPGHFRGVATVCLKLFNIARPERAYFGPKDAQQAAVVERLVEDLNLELEIRVVPTVREEDGLAVSSRNAYLSAEDREAAAALSKALRAGEEAHGLGADPLDAARAVLTSEPRLEPEYVELARLDGRVYLLAAARAGRTRLIDNVVLEGDPL